jgi:hypothetical protein
MKLLGFNFTKISATKISHNFENLRINTKIDIKNISETKQDLLRTKEDIVAIQFIYEINYEEKIADLVFEGNFLLSLDSKEYKEVTKNWKEKQISDEFKMALLNIIIKKSSPKALTLEEDLNLPFHLPFPSIKKATSSSD